MMTERENIFEKIVSTFSFGAVTGLSSRDRVIYSTDFSSDPKWTTDQPQNYFWDSGTQTYHVTTPNANPGYSPSRYAYTKVDFNGGSMKLEFDMKPTDLQWSAGFAFGLFDKNFSIFPQEGKDVRYIHVHPGLVDQGRHLGFYVRGKNGIQYSENLWDVLSENNWYRVVIEYDSVSDTVTLTTSDRNTGTAVGTMQISNIGGLPEDLDYLGFARDPVGDCCTTTGCPGFSCSSVATGYIDNVILTQGKTILQSDWEIYKNH